MPGTVLGTGGSRVNEIAKVPALYFLLEEDRQTKGEEKYPMVVVQ